MKILEKVILPRKGQISSRKNSKSELKHNKQVNISIARKKIRKNKI